ncbi:3-ketoacyl-CoA synthase 7-like [Magnolia sinica]|uniref:3-ketoacyl-CoA synthase 7-like n=1 Tax=Magnolia sinica TaxID=86752 RepID=UPI002657DA9E|nr:3-ketoacyl-CoA synthase 7-like [Magnolia sinica]
MEISQLNQSSITQTLISSTHLHFMALAILILITIYRTWPSKRIYLIDFSCYSPPDFFRIPSATYIEHAHLIDAFNEDLVDFQLKVLERSGLGNETCLPMTMNQLPHDGSLSASRREVKDVLFAAVEDLFAKNHIDPKTIDIIVSNCSIFAPTPSICSMIIHKFGFRSNVMSFHLSGMGCSAGLLSVSLVKDLLKVHNNSLALVLSMEAVSPGGYTGSSKSMLLTNILFRMGGTAILLSNRENDKSTARYELQHLVRTHLGSDDRSYGCIFQQPDPTGLLGVALSRAIIQVAGTALRSNIISLGPLVLPYAEQVRYGLSVIRRKVWPLGRDVGLYVPDFRKAFEHFCIHAGGRAVIDAIECELGLSDEDVEASKMTLYRFGNTSSSSIWYELCYLEAKGRVKKGDRVWQIAFGSGFKCNSAVWRCVSDLQPVVRNVWSDRIHLYPVNVPEVIDH